MIRDIKSGERRFFGVIITLVRGAAREVFISSHTILGVKLSIQKRLLMLVTVRPYVSSVIEKLKIMEVEKNENLFTV